MRILVATLLYAPDGGPSAPLYATLCEELSRRGHRVTVITAVAHYPSGRVAARDRGWRIRRHSSGGVEVLRVPVPSVGRGRLVSRLLQFVCFQIGAVLAGLRERYDVVLVGNPALETFLPFAVLGWLRRVPAVVSVHDVYPDVGVTLGIFRHRLVIAAVEMLERFCLNRAHRVRISAESFRPAMRRLGVAAERVALVYDWVDTALIRPVPRANAFALEHKLRDEFVVLYAGNLGLSQGLEHVVVAAERLATEPDIRMVFVGDGAGRSALEAEVARHPTAQVTSLPFQPRSRLAEVLGTADISLVCLKRGVGIGSQPSKTLSILASGRPLVASVDEASDTRRLVESAGAGLCVPPEDPSALAEAILALRRDPKRRADMGERGREYAIRHHSIAAAADRFEELLMTAARR